MLVCECGCASVGGSVLVCVWVASVGGSVSVLVCECGCASVGGSVGVLASVGGSVGVLASVGGSVCASV